MRKRSFSLSIGAAILTAAFATSHVAVSEEIGWEPSLLEDTMDGIVTRMYETLEPETLNELQEEDVHAFLTDTEREILATRFWHFNVNVPVIVSVMRHVGQDQLPFWLEERGFERTDMMVITPNFDYEVWQREFDAGRVALGVNGLDRHRPHYFVSAGALNADDELELSGFVPEDQVVYEMTEGSSIYHDWPGLQLTEVPEALQGHKLLPTIRGRARAAHLVDNAFRETPYPSSPEPDHIALTWSEDPQTTQTIQWRTDTSVTSGAVRYRPMDANADTWMETPADSVVEVEERMLINDRYSHHYRAVLRDLEPGQAYEYMVVVGDGSAQSDVAQFRTAPADPDAPFTFIKLSDTHNRSMTRTLLDDAMARYPEAAFTTIAGDQVDIGQYRDDWDQFFEYGGAFYSERPVKPTVGNHDVVDGLGAELYVTLLGLPHNGPDGVKPGRIYYFDYADALFLMLDSSSPIDVQAEWLDEVLAESDAKWKFAVFHFPPYSLSHDYDEIRAQWGAHFDEYGVDLVMAGHHHYYLRTHPMRGGEVAETGPIYLTSVAVSGRERRTAETPDFVAALDRSGSAQYVAIQVDSERISVRAHNQDGEIVDEFTIEE